MTAGWPLGGERRWAGLSGATAPWWPPRESAPDAPAARSRGSQTAPRRAQRGMAASAAGGGGARAVLGLVFRATQPTSTRRRPEPALRAGGAAARPEVVPSLRPAPSRPQGASAPHPCHASPAVSTPHGPAALGEGVACPPGGIAQPPWNLASPGRAPRGQEPVALEQTLSEAQQPRAGPTSRPVCACPFPRGPQQRGLGHTPHATPGLVRTTGLQALPQGACPPHPVPQEGQTWGAGPSRKGTRPVLSAEKVGGLRPRPGTLAPSCQPHPSSAASHQKRF